MLLAEDITFSLSVVHSVGLDTRVMTCTHHYSVLLLLTEFQTTLVLGCGIFCKSSMLTVKI